MQFLKMLLVALVAGLAVAFAINNWQWVPIQLWGGLIADVNLPLLLVVTFLLGLVPMWVAYRLTAWRARQRNLANERVIADLRAAAAAPSPPPFAADSAPAEGLPLPVQTTAPDAGPLFSEPRA